MSVLPMARRVPARTFVSGRPIGAATPTLVGLLILGALVPCSAAAADSTTTRVVYVDDDAGPGGNGSELQPYTVLADAVAEARTAAGSYTRVVISVAPGEYPVRQTLAIDFPVVIQGANEPHVGLDGRPNGRVKTNSTTHVVGVAPLFAIEPSSAEVLSDVSLRNLTIEGSSSSPMVPVVLVRRVQDYEIRDNVIFGDADAGIDVTLSSGIIEGNHVSGVNTCGICVAAGTATVPASVVVARNTSVGNGAGGLLLAGSVTGVAGPGLLTAIVLNNELSSHSDALVGFGVRILVAGREVPGDPVQGQVTAHLAGNTIRDNNNGIILDAGFASRLLPAAAGCDTRTFTGRLEVSLWGNTFSHNIRQAVVTFTRAQAFLNTLQGQPNPLANSQYLKGATFSVFDLDLSLASVDVDDPDSDPFTGRCPVSGALGNTFRYNGVAQ